MTSEEISKFCCAEKCVPLYGAAQCAQLSGSSLSPLHPALESAWDRNLEGGWVLIGLNKRLS
jgi:hypothetical protein